MSTRYGKEKKLITVRDNTRCHRNQLAGCKLIDSGILNLDGYEEGLEQVAALLPGRAGIEP